jgi:predicted RND superfamily exporter protein
MEGKEKLTTLDRLCLFLSRHRLRILIIILVITGVFLYVAFKIRGEVILQDMLPYDHPYLKLHGRFAEVFGSGGSTLVIVVNAKKGDIFNPKTLGKIKGINDEIELWDEVYRILTVSMASNSVKVVKTVG